MIISTPAATTVALTASDFGKLFRPTSCPAAQTYVLPPPSSGVGLDISFQRWGKNLTVQSNAGEMIQLPGGMTTVFTMTANGQSGTLHSDGWSWIVHPASADFWTGAAVVLPIVKLDSKPFTGVTEVVFATGFDPVYREYWFKLHNVSQSAHPGQLSMLVSKDAGVTWDTGPNYKTGGVTDWTEGTTQLLAVKDSTSGLLVAADGADNVAHGMSGDVVLKTIGGAVHTSYTANMVRTDSGNHPLGSMYRGFYTGGGRINAVKFFLKEGGAATLAGSIDLWGVK